MKNERFSKVLKEYRKKNDLSVKEVSMKLNEKSIKVAPKTIYGWESGQTQPDADTLLVLCEMYHIDHILNTFGYTSRIIEHSFSEYDAQLIKKYHEHPEMHEAIHRLLGME